MIYRKLLPALEKEMASDKTIVLTGMRRVGKTTLIRYLYDNLEGKRKLYLDLENPLNQQYFAESNYDKIKLYFDKLAVGTGKDLVVFIDEIQNVKSIPSVVKYLQDTFQIKFVLTGSASFYLKNLFSESLSGRKRIFELFPLDFEEFLSYKHPSFKRPSINDQIEKPIYNLFNTPFYEYLTYGGFPGVVVKDGNDEKLAELNDIYTSYFQKEVSLLSDFRRLEIVKSIMSLLLHRVGSKLDVSKVASELGVSRITILEYLDFLKGTYFIDTLKQYSPKIDVSIRSQEKPYICDNGFLEIVDGIPEAVRLENTVETLLKTKGELFYYQDGQGKEIDFVLEKDGKRIGFEVKTTAFEADIERLEKTAHSLKLSDYYLVSSNYSTLPKVIYPFQL